MIIKYRQGVTPWYRVPWTEASLLLLGSSKRMVETKLKTIAYGGGGILEWTA